MYVYKAVFLRISILIRKYDDDAIKVEVDFDQFIFIPIFRSVLNSIKLVTNVGFTIMNSDVLFILPIISCT